MINSIVVLLCVNEIETDCEISERVLIIIFIIQLLYFNVLFYKSSK